MIGLIFQLASENIEVRIDNKNIYFRTVGTSGAWATIEHIKLDYNGVIKEHPDLKDNKEWRQETIKRFKEKINKMKTETEISNYIIDDLTKFGYVALYRQRQGFRPEKICP